GSCFPKDVKALIHTAKENGYTMQVIEAVERVNETQKAILFEKLQRYYNGDLKGRTIALWGLSFKPETDDMREAPSLVIIDKLLKAGCTVRVFDPIAMNECKRRIGDTVTYCKDIYETVESVDALMVVTEWKEFRLPEWNRIKNSMKTPVIFDGRNIYNPDELKTNGLEYFCIGK
ncbi:MAG: UDP-glucose/GDP-mannose dehydrogenase family protein, partial [Bacteroidales bacterium]|nr:UDP-glucose/GDP-mannose dehydrogenase family protein [Bacteroidales bacterium]